MSWKRLGLACCLCAVSTLAQAGPLGSPNNGAGKSCGCGEGQPAACGPKFPRLAKLLGKRASRTCKPAGCGESAPAGSCGPNSACGAGCTDGAAGCGEDNCSTAKRGVFANLFPKQQCKPAFGRYIPCAPEIACGDEATGCSCGECATTGCGPKRRGLLNRLFKRKSRCAPAMLTTQHGCTDNVEAATGCGPLTPFNAGCGTDCGAAGDSGCGEGCDSSGSPKRKTLFRGLFAGWKRNKSRGNECPYSQGQIISTATGCGDAGCATGDSSAAGCSEAGCGEATCAARGCGKNPCQVAAVIRESMTACYARQRAAAIHRLGDSYECNCHPEIMHAFIYALNDADERVRRKAADEIGDQLSRHRECCSQEIISALQAACDDCDRWVRWEARQSLRYCQTKCGMGCTDGCPYGCGEDGKGGCAGGGCSACNGKRVRSGKACGCTDIGCTDRVATQATQAPAPVNVPAKKMEAAPATDGGAKPPEPKAEPKKPEGTNEAPAPPPPAVGKSVPAKSIWLRTTRSLRSAGRSTRR